MGMVDGMVAHQVPLALHAFDEAWIAFDEIGSNEKRRFHTALLQRVEDGRRVAVFVSAIEREVDALVGFGCIADVIGVEFRKCTD